MSDDAHPRRRGALARASAARPGGRHVRRRQDDPRVPRRGVYLDIPHIEIDALFHGPGWTPQDSFESDVHKFSAGPCWVTEWQYTQVRAILAQRADLLVWLNLPRALVMRQVMRRTVRRRLARQVL